MKSNKEILDVFGELIVKQSYDDAIDNFQKLINGTTKWGIGKQYTDVLAKLSTEDQDVLTKYLKGNLGDIHICLFKFI